MINYKKISLKLLNKLNVQERVQAIKNPGIGRFLMSALTPTEIAELFPRYYLKSLPDISGFLKALPTGTMAAKQAFFQEQLNNTASGEAAGENMEEGGWRRKLQEGVSEETATPLKPGEVPQPKLTPEQKTVIESLQKGENIPASDPKVKFIGTMTPQELKDVGLEKFKGEGDKEFYKYVPPVVTDEEVKKSISSSGSVKQIIDAAAAKNNIDPRIMYGIVRGESIGKTSGEYDIGDSGKSFGPFQMHMSFLGKNFMSQTGLDPRDISTMPQQADWIAKEIAKRGGGDAARKWVASQWYGYGKQQLGQTGTPYNINERASVGDSDWSPKWFTTGVYTKMRPSVDPITQDYSKEQLDAEREKVIREINAQRIGTIAGKIQGNQDKEITQQKSKVSKGEFPEWVSDRSKRELSALNSGFVTDLLEASKRTGIRFNVTQGMRTAEEAAKNAASGRGVRNSQHLYGAAADIKILDENGNPVGHDRRDLYEKFAKAYEQASKERGGSGRWLGHSATWSHDIWHFDQGIGYGQSHKRDPYGDLKPTLEDIKETYKESSPAGHPFGQKVIEEKEKQQQQQRIEESLKPSPDVPQGVERPAPKGQNVPGQPLTTASPEPPKPEQPKPEQPKPEPPKIVPQRYKFNEASFEDAVRNKYGILAAMYDRAGLIEEFKKNLPKGVTYEKGVLTIKDPNSPAIKETIAGLEKEFGKDTVKSVITQIKEEKKKEEPKPEVKAEPRQPETTQQQRIEKSLRPSPDVPQGVERPAPQGQIRPRELKMDTKNSGVSFNTEKVQEPAPSPEVKPVEQKAAPAPEVKPVEQKAAPAPEVKPVEQKATPTPEPAPAPAPAPAPEVKPVEQTPPTEPVKTNEAGGKNETNTSQISAMPIGGIKSDNSVVVDANQKPLFTMNTEKEAAVYDPTKRNVDVIPKSSTIGKTPSSQSNIQSEMDILRSDIMSLKEGKQNPAQDITKGSKSHITDRDSGMIENIMSMTKHIFLDPSAARAYSRARFVETGDSTNDFHHSGGNSNMKN